MNLVLNSSPLITLANANFLEFLPKLSTSIASPEAVFVEVMNGPDDDPLKNIMGTLPWLKRVQLEPPLSPLANWQLGAGETEVVEWARRNPEYTAVLDDKAARRAGLALGIRLTGTLGLIALGVRKGIIPSFIDAVSKLRNAGYYIDNELVDTVASKLKNQPK